MSNRAAWQEVESVVHRPGQWLALLVGTMFTVMGGIALVAAEGQGLAGWKAWGLRVFLGVFVLTGSTVLAWVVRNLAWPSYIRHAPSDVLPNVPQDPVVYEGAIVHGRLTHELSETPDGWELRPKTSVQRSNRMLLWGFGIPFLVFFAGVLTFGLHERLEVGGWLGAAAISSLATAMCGGAALLIIFVLMRTGYRQLSSLGVPRSGSSLEFETGQKTLPDDMGLAQGLKWLLEGGTERRRLTIPRDLVAAVQVCPWKFVMNSTDGRSTTWAVQGLLVLANAQQCESQRLPLLLTGDCASGSQLMRRLADVLQVPFLFHADAAGWQAEAVRASNRPPLRSGGMMS